MFSIVTETDRYLLKKLTCIVYLLNYVKYFLLYYVKWTNLAKVLIEKSLLMLL